MAAMWHCSELALRIVAASFVVNYYTGELGELDFEQAFGMTAQQLGDKVIAFSKRLVD